MTKHTRAKGKNPGFLEGLFGAGKSKKKSPTETAYDRGYTDAVKALKNPPAKSRNRKKKNAGLVEPILIGAAAGASGAAVTNLMQKRNRASKNPLEAAAEFSERFHGRPAEEVIEIEERVKEHSVLTKLGDLVEIVIIPLTGRGSVTVEFEGTHLASSEDGLQLYLEGGDQSLDLSSFGLTRAEASHDEIELGRIYSVTYETDKHHLGEQGGEGLYVHEFGDEGSPVGQRKMPMAKYDRLNRKIEIVGGVYRVDAAGIIH